MLDDILGSCYGRVMYEAVVVGVDVGPRLEHLCQIFASITTAWGDWV